MALISGTLINAYNEPLAGATISFESKVNSEGSIGVPIGVFGTTTTDVNGNYSFTILNGEYDVRVNHNLNLQLVGSCVVNDLTPNTDLITLVENY